MSKDILARKIFVTLVKGYYPNEYLVLNDCNYMATIYADSESAAIEKFEKGEYKKC